MRRIEFQCGAVASMTMHQSFLGVLDMGVPAGVIAMWSGTIAAIPQGWTLCDGSKGTPDLRGLFVKGSAAGANPGVTGGSDTHTHSDHAAHTHAYTEVPNHTHPISISDPGHVHAISCGATDGTVGRVDSSSQAQQATFNTNSATTGITASSSNPVGGVAAGTTSGPGEALTHSTSSNEPAYFSLAFIMKV